MPQIRDIKIVMKLLLSTALFGLLLGSATFAQQAGGNKPPKAFGPVKTITYEYSSVTFSRDKTRIDEGVSNGRNIVWLFTSEGRLLSSEIFEKDGKASGTKSLYNCDSKGRLTLMVDYLFGKLSHTEDFTYPDDRHVKITRVFYVGYGKNTVIEVDEYDQSANIIKATFHDDDGTQIESYKYDGRGNPIEFVVTDGSGKQLIKETYKYEFDSYGNWTKRSSETSADPRFGIPSKNTMTRKIAYY